MMKQTTTLILGSSLLAAAALSLSSCGKSDSSGAPATAATSAAPAAPAGDLEEIKPTYPKPAFQGTPVPPGDVPNLEEPVGEDKVMKTFMAPKGTTNVALNKKVTSSDPAIVIPSPDALKLITDGDADSSDGCFVELAPGPQWVQIDLGAPTSINKIATWHYHKQAQAYVDVVIQVSDDKEFKTGVTTLFNSDHDDTLKMGAGSDPAYIETNHGRVIDGKNTKAQYVRLYSNGNTSNEMNHYCEVAVYGVPGQ